VKYNQAYSIYANVFIYICIHHQMMINLHETITSRLEQEDIELLDKFIKMGLFANRSEAVRVILSKELKELAKKQVKIDIQKFLETKPLLTEQDLLEYGTRLFPSSVATHIAEGRER
jgi:Arc/MetJ-type ribon-helix-helix transcriptional regulator